ncbi:MAG TPA: portal protein, partial [Candidatus Sulfotelmatobacter sp.]|nr:portal protein [Candidatus Sulfotelmatobacter sp.]
MALERFKLAADAEARWRREALEDFNFYLGEQWPQDIKTQRDRDRRPCLTINRLKPMKRIVCNEMRQQRPSIQVNPVGDGATVETAQIEQGIIRHIEVNSDAEVAYDTADDHMVIGGRGWLEASTRYRPGRTMSQEIHIGAATNPFMHYTDPNAAELDKSDAKWHFKIWDYTRAEFESKYPDSEAASLSDFQSVGDNGKDWLQKDAVRVAEYWYIEYEDSTLYQLEDGSIVEALPEGVNEDDEGVSARPWEKPKCMWCKITAVDVLDGNDDATGGRETVWDSIPNIPVIGEELDVNGKVHMCGMVRDAKDPQRQFNYWETAATEMIALAPKAQWKGYAEVIEGHEEEWKNANRTNYSILTGKAVVKDNQLLPLPERDQAEPPIQAMAAMRQSGAANLEAVTGINDAVLGRMKADESGKAVLARQKQGDVSNLNYSDNSARAKRRLGRLILPAIPKVYDVPTIMRIVNPDGTSEHIVTHLGEDQQADAAAMMQQNPAIKKIFDLSVGTYDVTVSVGPNYQTKRQEAVASIMALIQAEPAVLALIGDLLVGNMDWNQA